jgi:AcrR family transcriptional regulator
MAKLYPEYGERVRERIVEVAYELYLENGYGGMKMDEIAARLGVSKPAVYRYFRGKEALFAAVLEYGRKVGRELYTDAFRGRDFMTGCDVLFDVTIEFITQYSGLYTDVLYLASRNEKIRAILKETQERGIDAFEAFIRDLQAEGRLPPGIDVRNFAIGLDTLLGGFAMAVVIGMDRAEAKAIWLDSVRRWIP